MWVCCSRHAAAASWVQGVYSPTLGLMGLQSFEEGKKLKQGGDSTGAVRIRARTHHAALNPFHTSLSTHPAPLKGGPMDPQ